MRVLVTGADGFVGKVLCRKLREAQYSVRAALWSAEDYSRARGDLPDGIDAVLVGDIGTDVDWEGPLRGIEVVIHLAARVHVMHEHSADSLGEFRRINTRGTERLAWMAAEHGVRRLVFVSTIKVNGEQTFDKPFTETDVPSPNDAYAVSKWEAELALMAISAKTQMEGVIVRPPLVYGPGVRGNFLRLLGLVHAGLPLPLKSANNRRSLIGVENLAHFLVHCVEHPSAASNTFLISDGEDISTAELVRRLSYHLGREDRLFPCPENVLRNMGRCFRRADLVDRLFGSLVVSSERAVDVLGWRRLLTLDEGLAATTRWYTESRPGRQ